MISVSLLPDLTCSDLFIYLLLHFSLTVSDVTLFQADIGSVTFDNLVQTELFCILSSYCS